MQGLVPVYILDDKGNEIPLCIQVFCHNERCVEPKFIIISIDFTDIFYKLVYFLQHRGLLLIQRRF